MRKRKPTDYSSYPKPKKRKKRSQSEERTSGNRPELERSYSHHDTPPINTFNHYHLTVLQRLHWQAGPIRSIRYRLDFSSIPPMHPLQLISFMATVFDTALRQLLVNTPSNSIGQLFAVHSDMRSRCIPSERLPVNQLNFNHFADRIARFLQSAEHLRLSDLVLTLTIHHPPPSVGAHPYFASHETLAQALHCLSDPLKKSNRIPQKYRNLCFPLNLARGLFILEHPDLNRTSQKVRHYGETVECRNRALALVDAAGLTPRLGPFKLEDLKEFEKALPTDVAVFCYLDTSTPYITLNPSGSRHIYIFIFYDAGSYHSYEINPRMMAAFTGCKYWCSKCLRGYHNQPHKCPESTCFCGNLNCANIEPRPQVRLHHTCPDCNFFFSTPTCLEAHTCTQKTRCKVCRLIIDGKHQCGKPYCNNCLTYHSPLIICNVQPDKPKPNKKRVFYGDIESAKAEDGQQLPNLLALASPNGSNYIFKGPKAMEQFAQQCSIKNSPFANSFIVFHYGAKYDLHLVHHALVNIGVAPKILLDGQRIMTMELPKNKIIFRDSYLYIAIPLAAFPKTFGLATGPKGEFPHDLNNPKWLQFGKKTVYKEVVDGVEYRFPQLKYFKPQEKKPAKAEELRKWHEAQVLRFEQNANLYYCAEEEIETYCWQDVHILMGGMEKLRTTTSEEHPKMELLDKVTFTAYNNSVFRTYYMPPDSITLLPPMGFDPKNRSFSPEAMAWQAFMKRKLGLHPFYDARHLGERRIGGLFSVL